MKKIALFFAFIVLTACQPVTPDPAAIQTAIAQTQAAQPSPTIAASKTPVPTDTPQPTATPVPSPVAYYYFVSSQSTTYPAGSVVILEDILVLAPGQSNILRGPDVAANLEVALHAVITDPDNAWVGTQDFGLDNITMKGGTATVALRGKIQGAGDIVMIAARMQFLLTVFAEPVVQSALITVDGKNIANLGISHERDVRPENYAFTRAEIEAFMAENTLKAK